MKASLIICTRNREAQLRRCLRSVERLRCAYPWEAVLVDNGSSDTTAVVIADFARSAPVPVVAAFEPQRGLGRARNAGVAAARGDIMAFTDDDCYPQVDYLDRIVDAFERHPIGWLGGAIHLYDRSDFPLTISTIKENRLLPPGVFIWPGLIQGANMAFRRRVLQRIGGFDPDLGPGTPFIADDVDAVARASAAGFGGGFFTAPVVLHHHGRKAGEARRLRKIYDRSRGAYFAKLLLAPETRRCFAPAIAVNVCLSSLCNPPMLGRVVAGAAAYWSWRRRKQRPSADAPLPAKEAP